MARVRVQKRVCLTFIPWDSMEWYERAVILLFAFFILAFSFTLVLALGVIFQFYVCKGTVRSFAFPFLKGLTWAGVMKLALFARPTFTLHVE